MKVVIEGQEEVGGGALTTYPPTNPELFAADAMVIADMGSLSPGVPTLTIALRGMANVTVEARTLASAKHSGQYGGAAPDALLALIRALGTLHDENGDVAVEGLRRNEWTGGGPSEQEFRELAEVVDGQPLIGTGSLGSRVWSGPAITVIGIDAPSVDDALNAVSPYARAIINVRVHPEQDAARSAGGRCAPPREGHALRHNASRSRPGPPATASPRARPAERTRRPRRHGPQPGAPRRSRPAAAGRSRS